MVTDGRLIDHYDPVMYRLMTFPLVTIAAMNGHSESCLTWYDLAGGNTESHLTQPLLEE